MTLGDWMFIFVIAIVVVAAIVCGIAWKVAFKDGREAGILHERNMRNTERIRRNRLEAATDEFWGITGQTDPWENWLKQVVSDGDGERLADTAERRLVPVRNLTDTGAMAIVTDDYIERMRAEEAAYREGLAS